MYIFNHLTCNMYFLIVIFWLKTDICYSLIVLRQYSLFSFDSKPVYDISTPNQFWACGISTKNHQHILLELEYLGILETASYKIILSL